MNVNVITILIPIIIGIGLGLIISKIETNLPWKELLIIKYKVLVLAPILRFVCGSILRKKRRLGKLYKLRNRLQEKIF